ncbi:MAG: flavodoxin-dependent (E)-4-hydroxy-3-methylbut-2-enyl-diphosphate synthase [Candidatus Gracilibacteria bacterium]|nr:flavodoxin-dependent (E)-4-hydroxy-3-methylbut-2-enyl-diphosphate synthase [Candidatus Gracilibacteria bacterium]MDD5179276.1 flavodoxin-dependent (E)-4-hydroxy-3-methylbut-2-enyl-diphosphate synthase [Candidatus Gracilibacteria bacterium]
MPTKIIQIGKVKIGGKNPVAIQSMCNTKTQNVEATVKQIRSLATAGCEIVRIAIPDMEAAEAVKEIRKQTQGIPLVADIHFDYRLALLAVENGVDKIRINPGNIGGEDKLREVVLACKKRGIPIRVGVNAGSLEKNLKSKTIAAQLAESAVKNVKAIEKLGYRNLVVSAKASDVKTSVEAYRILAKKISYPLHLGITEAGSEKLGIMKSAAGLGSLLLDGIGNTIRISLTAQPEVEVKAARDLLRVLGLRKDGIEVISCPTCGRTEVDLIPLVAQVEEAVEGIKKNLTVAVMGCMVNGPGEASHADFALVGGKKMFALYAKGKLVKTISEKEALGEFVKLIQQAGVSSLSETF